MDVGGGRGRMEPKLQVVDFVKDFDRTRVINHISFDVAPGEFVVLLGASGCGKSTTLNLIAGLEELTSGDVILRGQRVTDVPPNKRGMAMVFQNYALYPHMTVLDNLTFNLRLSRVAAAVRRRDARDVAATLGIESLLDRKPSQLSGGQQQRVALGRALIRKPEVFLLDEPLSNLDAKLRQQMRVELKRLHMDLGATVVYVTHDQFEAMTLANRIILMRSGEIAAQGRPADLYLQPPNLYTADFLGSPPINLLTGALSVTDGRLQVALASGVRLDLAGAPRGLPRDVVIGVRPEDVELRRDGSAAAQTVRLIESVGPDQYVHVSVGERQSLVARRPAMEPWQVGDPVVVELRAGRVHVFDPAREVTLATV